MRFRSVAALVAVLLLAAPVRAQEALDRKYEKGPPISLDGGHKAVYSVVGHPDLVLLVMGDESPKGLLGKEKTVLDELAAAGIPAARFLETGTFEGHDAAIQRRFEISTKDPGFSDFDVYMKLLSEKTIADAKKIMKGLAAHPEIKFLDFQLLVGKDGRLVVNDPFPESALPENWDQIVEETGWEDIDRTFELEHLIRLSNQVLEVKSLLARFQSMKGAEDPELHELFGRRQVGLPGVPEFDEQKVKNALVKYLEMEPTTEQARAVAKAIRDGKIDLRHKFHWSSELGPDELRVSPINYFIVMASNLVYEGAKRLLHLGEALESEVLAEAQRLRFLQVKGAPDKADRDEIHQRASELAQNPEDLVDVVSKMRKLPASASDKVHLAARAREVLGPTRSGGISNLLEERVGEGSHPKDAVER